MARPSSWSRTIRLLARTQSLPIVVLTATAQRYEEHVAVGFMNIDGFKGINDRFGHAVGDQVLIHVAHRLSGLERQSDMVARYGGNEFTLLVERVGGRESAEALLSCFVTTVSSYRSGSKDTRSTCR
jgi:diguanylate cyclase (GGDEF)-like protein